MSAQLADVDVAVVGGGPTGLMLAAEVALAGARAVVIERRSDRNFDGWRAGGLHARTIEIFDQRGIVDRFLSAGQIAQVAAFAGTRLDIGDFPTRHNYGLGLRQKHIERILEEWVVELGVPIYRGFEMTDFVQDDAGVRVRLGDRGSMRASYLVGCDGGRSATRKIANIAFPGWDATTSSLMAEVETDEEPPLGVHRNAFGIHSFGKERYEIRDGEVVYADGGPVGVMVTESNAHSGTDAPTLDDLRGALTAACGTDYGIRNPRWISRFSDVTRQAATYRSGRVLLAGDAAHVHAPDGGQGLNLGVQDAFNLGWKLARAVKSTEPGPLLDTYHAERHPVAARVLRLTMAAVALRRPDERTTALREFASELMGMDEPRKRFAAMLSGLDVRYDFGDAHPLLGRRIPDLDVKTADGPMRVFSLLRDGRPLLIGFGERNVFEEAAGWNASIRVVAARYDGLWELPLLGEVPAPQAVLVRPDGHVAWVACDTHPGSPLRDALSTWFGPPSERNVKRSTRAPANGR